MQLEKYSRLSHFSHNLHGDTHLVQMVGVELSGLLPDWGRLILFYDVYGKGLVVLNFASCETGNCSMVNH